MKKLIVLLVGAALVLLSSVAASDCEDIIATDVSLGDDVLVQNGAAVTVSKEARDEYVEIMTARDEARYQLMIATGDLWIGGRGWVVLSLYIGASFHFTPMSPLSSSLVPGLPKS